MTETTRRSQPRRMTLAAGGAYLLVSFAYFGIRVAPHFGRDMIGTGGDPQLFVWSLAWWPHAVAHGINPFVTGALWTPVGSNLAWATSVPGLALLLAPVTWLAGPVAAYNTAAILLPGLAAWTAFLLCRYVTGAFWPSLAGGYFFGFSSYVLGHELAHLHATSVFLVPLCALAILRFLDGEIGPWGLMARLGPLLAFQFAFGTEVYFTLALAVVVGLAACAAVAPIRRPRLRALVAPLAGAYAIGAVLVSPLLYYAFTDFHHEVITKGDFPADLMTFGFPNRLAAIGGRFAAHFVPTAPYVSAEAGQYLGLPALAIVAMFCWKRRRDSGGRFLALAFALGALLTLGSELQVRGNRLFPLPWRLVQHLPVFRNVIPGRLALYVSLVAAVVIALWAADRGSSRAWRVGLTLAALVVIVPDLALGVWKLAPDRPAFFADGTYRSCLRPGANILVLPQPFRNEALLWQAEAGFRFGIADAGLNSDAPANLPRRATMLSLLDNNVPVHGAQAVIASARAQAVDAIVVVRPKAAEWTSLLDPVLPGQRIGGVVLYRLRAAPASCRQA